MRHSVSCSAFVLVLVLTSGVAIAQLTTGTPRFGSFGGGPFDTVDLADLNVHFEIPVVNKAGRGMPFTYSLSYDSTVWYPVGVSGNQNWQPVLNWGWRGSTEIAVGYISDKITQTTDCNGQGVRTTFSSWIYHDPFGTPHPFAGTTYKFSGAVNSCPPDSPPLNTQAQDASGYTLHATSAGSATLTSASGQGIAAPINTLTGAGTAQDANGNLITVNTGGQFFDTLSNVTPALTVTGQGTATSPMTFTYTSPANSNAPYVMHFTNKTLRTYFRCAGGIADYGPVANTPLVTDVTLPDNTKYQFTYEPSNDPNNPGSVTGRIATVTLPTGGTITYQYSGGTNGINCADGAPATMTRTLSPGGTWTYARAGTSPVTTTVTDPTPQANQTEVKFQGIYPTQVKEFQGSTSGTLLRTTLTCYNGVSVGTPANCPTSSFTLPINRTSVFTYLPDSAGLQAEVNSLFDAFGLVNRVEEYDYGTGAVGALKRSTITTYTGGMSNGIVDRPSSVVIKDGGGVTNASTSYLYDEGSLALSGVTAQHVSITGSRGNLTTVNAQANGTTHLYRKFTYFDTGSLNTSTDLSTSSSTNGALTTYNYTSGAPSCNNAFVTSISEPLSLSRSMTWNCTGGVLLSLTDENGKIASTSYTDPYFWRPASTTDQTSNVTSFSYLSPTRTESAMTFNGGSSVSDHLTQLDGLGRLIVSQTRQAPLSSNYDSVETDYDVVGRVSKVTLPYSGAAGALCSGTCPGTTAAYDALGRPLTVSDAGGGSTGYSYPKNDVYQTVGPAPAGENTKRKQLEYDALGRLTSVCEVTSGTGNGACNQTSVPPPTGYWTTYTYDVLDNLTGVTQNAQAASGSRETRTYAYDMLGRLTSEVNPETNNAASTYSYDTAASGCSNVNPAGNLAKRVDAAGNSTCNNYDSVHRVTSISYPSGTTPAKNYVYDAATVNGIAMTNPKARLAEAYTCTACPGTKITDLGFSYTARGEVANVYESSPHSAGYYNVGMTYWPNGSVNTMSGPGFPTFTYTLNPEGENSAVSAMTGQNPVTSTLYNPAGQVTSVTLGSGDSDSFTFDPNTGRMTQYQATIGGSSTYGTLTWNANGTLSRLVIVDPFNASDAQTCTYLYDDLGRIGLPPGSTGKSVDCGATKWQQNFSYDPFGNITKTVPGGASGVSFQPTYNIKNQYQSLPGFTPIYDAAGNLTSDSFHTYTWNADGHPVSIDSNTLTYDALGRVVEMNNSGTITDIVYTPSGRRLAYYNNGVFVGFSLDLPGGLRAGGQTAGAGVQMYSHPDWLGSQRTISTSGRTWSGSAAFAPFGEFYAAMGASQPLFTNQYNDEAASGYGLYDFPAREQHGAQGRWISPDPAGLAAVNRTDPQSWNRYAYVGNHPLNSADPSGLFIEPICDPFFDFTCGGCDPSDASCEPGPPGCGPFFGCGPFPPPPGGGGPGPGRGGVPGGGGRRIGGKWPNGETLGLPTGLNLKPMTLADLIGLSPGTQCDFGVCTPIEDGFTSGVICGIDCWWEHQVQATVSVFAKAALDVTILMMSRGGRQNIVPSWAEGARPLAGESASQFADRLCKARYPPDGAGCGEGPTSERSKIRKWARDKFGI